MRAILNKKQFDDFESSIVACGVPELAMQEAAAGRIAGRLVDQIKARPETSLLFLIGPGNNGADGLAVLRKLFVEYGPVLENVSSIFVYILSGKNTESWKIQHELLKRSVSSEDLPLGKPHLIFGSASKKRSPSELIVLDAFFGSNFLIRSQSFSFESLESFLARQPSVVFALDVPSGLSVDGVLDPQFAFLRADETWCLGAYKSQLFEFDGIQAAGRVRLEPLMVPEPPEPKVEARQAVMCGVGDAVIQNRRPRSASFKSTKAAVLVLGGRTSRGGAAVLSGSAAMACGAGLVGLLELGGWPSEKQKKFGAPTRVSKSQHFVRGDPNDLGALKRDFDVWIFGPGIYGDEDFSSLGTLLAKLKKPRGIVVDAGGLKPWLLTDLGKRFSHVPTILTPHPGEARDLVGSHGESRFGLLSDVVGLAARKMSRVAAVLKGSYPLIIESGSEKQIVFNLSDQRLGVAGSGDVFNGIVAAALAKIGSKDSLSQVLVNACSVQKRVLDDAKDLRAITADQQVAFLEKMDL